MIALVLLTVRTLSSVDPTRGWRSLRYSPHEGGDLYILLLRLQKEESSHFQNPSMA